MKKPPTNKKTAQQDLRTPAYLFEEISRRYGPFDTDLAADEDNTLCTNYFDLKADALRQEWSGRCWCNPPYKNIMPWIYKAIHSVTKEESCERIVMLLPARVGTEWYKWASMWGTIHRVVGRVRFEKNGQPMKNPFEDSIIVVFERELSMRELLRDSRRDKAYQEPGGNSTKASA